MLCLLYIFSRLWCTFFTRWVFLNRTQGKVVETATTTAPIVAVAKMIIIITRKTHKEVTTENKNNECQQ